MKVVVFLRHEIENSTESKLKTNLIKLKSLWLTKSQTAALLAAHVSTNAQWALFRKATSMSSTLTPALVAALAPALARIIERNETALKGKKPAKNRLF